MSASPSANAARPNLVTIVLPAKDEEAAIGGTLRSLPLPTLRALGYDVETFVLDGQSVDATAAIARQWGATVVADREPGKGAALRNALTHFRGEFIVMLDADGTYPADSIPRILGPLARGEAEIVMGKRLPRPGSMPEHHRVGNALLSLVASALYARFCPDVCTGLWGFRQEALRALPLQSRGFGLEAELFALSARLRRRVAHVLVDYLPRSGPTKLSSGRDGLRILRRLLRSRVASLRPAGAAAAGASAPQPAPTGKVHG